VDVDAVGLAHRLGHGTRLELDLTAPAGGDPLLLVDAADDNTLGAALGLGVQERSAPRAVEDRQAHDRRLQGDGGPGRDVDVVTGGDAAAVERALTVDDEDVDIGGQHADLEVADLQDRGLGPVLRVTARHALETATPGTELAHRDDLPGDVLALDEVDL